MAYIGKAVPSKLDHIFVAGKGQYTADIALPGMVLSAYKLLQEYSHPDETTIRHNLAGNLCHCTGYQNIIEAMQVAGSK